MAQARWVTPGRAWALVTAGLLAMFWAAERSNRYRPNSFDPDDPLPCASRPEGCPSPEGIEAALRTAWWWVGVGALLVLVGVALSVWRSSSAPHRRSHASFSAVVHAVLAAACSGVLLVLMSFPLVLALFMGPHAIPGALVATWLAEAGVLAGLDALIGRAGTPRRSWVTGLAVSAGVLGAMVWALWIDRIPADPWWSSAVVGAGAAGLGTLLARLLTDPLRPGGPARRRRGAAVAVVVVLGIGSAVVAGDVLRRPLQLPVAAAPPPATPAPSTEPPSPTPAPVTRPAPAPVTTPPPPVAADVPCTASDLRFTVPGFDGAMGARAASIQAANVGAAPCWVEGVPVVTLLQGGRPLRLTVEPGQSPQGGPAPVQRVGIAPGGRALALLTWRTYGGWADAETPQSLTVALDAASPPVPVVVSASGPAPFDIADGGAWGIAAWAPPWS